MDEFIYYIGRNSDLLLYSFFPPSVTFFINGTLFFENFIILVHFLSLFSFHLEKFENNNSQNEIYKSENFTSLWAGSLSIIKLAIFANNSCIYSCLRQQTITFLLFLLDLFNDFFANCFA